VLAEEDPEKLLRLPATTQAASLFNAPDATLLADVEARKTALLRDVNERNLGYFEQEVQKLDAWADDLKLGLEQEIKEIDREIKEVRRTAATSPTLEEKLSWQKKQRELESKRSKLRRELFVRQDEVEAQRNDSDRPVGSAAPATGRGARTIHCRVEDGVVELEPNNGITTKVLENS
jgi:hypothetical protein